MTFFNQVSERARKTNSLLCVGIDPSKELWSVEALAAYCRSLIIMTKPYAAAFKANLAFFESHGSAGLRVLKQLRELADGVPLILDAKRGDVGHSSVAYARALGNLGGDAITVNPYMGQDSVQPFFDRGLGVFVLCKTSNAGSACFQTLTVNGDTPLYMEVADQAVEWGECGLVVGATDLGALKRVRDNHPETWILAPGVGAQKADLAGTVRAGIRTYDGLGLLVSISRGISSTKDWRGQARYYRDEINKHRKLCLVEALYRQGCIKFGDFTLKSGLKSNVYVDLRGVVADVELTSIVADAYISKMQDLEFKHIAALPLAALPIGTAIHMKSGWPLVYPREPKDYGLPRNVVGSFQKGDRVVIVDDVLTTGETKIAAIETLKREGLIIDSVVVLVDREMGGIQTLKDRGIQVHALYRLGEISEILQDAGYDLL